MYALKVAMKTDQFVRAVKLTDQHTRKNVSAAVRRGTKAVAQGAISRVPVRSSELQGTIRDEYSKDGMVGFVKAGYGKLLRRSRSVSEERRANLKARRRAEKQKKAKGSKNAMNQLDLGVYAPVVERGDRRRNKPAKPFLHPSLRAERPRIQSDMKHALNTAARQGGFSS
jgi:hypothetical protein